MLGASWLLLDRVSHHREVIVCNRHGEVVRGTGVRHAGAEGDVEAESDVAAVEEIENVAGTGDKKSAVIEKMGDELETRLVNDAMASASPLYHPISVGY